MRSRVLLALAFLAQAEPELEIIQETETLDDDFIASLESKTPDLFEGDIIKPPKSDGENSALRFSSSKWPNGKVPVYISRRFNKSQKRKIIEAMIEIAEKTCVRFRYRNDNDEDYVIILRDPKGTCNSVVGRKGGFQELRLGDECLNARKTILHELMHAIGFIHEHRREPNQKLSDWDTNLVKTTPYMPDHH